MRSVKYIGFIGILLIAIESNAQYETLFLDQEAVIDYCMSYNDELQTAKDKIYLSELSLQEAKHWWLPTLQLETRMHKLNGAAMNSDGAIFTDVDQEYFNYGGSLGIDWDIAKEIYASKFLSSELIAEKVYWENQKKNIIESSVEKYYQWYLFHYLQSIYDSLITNSEELKNQFKILFDAGLKSEHEFLLIEANHSNLLLDGTEFEKQEQQARTELLMQLGMPFNAAVSPKEPFETQNGIPLLEETAYNEDLSAHPAVKYFQGKSAAMKQKSHQYTTGLLFPRLVIDVQDGQFGSIFTPLYNTYSIYGLLQWEIPIAQIFGKYEKKKSNLMSKIYSDQAAFKMKKLNTQNDGLLAQLETAKEHSNQAIKGKDVAYKAYVMSQQRQELGIAQPFELLQSQEIYVTSLEHFGKSIIDYNIILFKLELLHTN